MMSAPKNQDGPLYVAVEGPIGVGKTTLVNRLNERLGAPLFLKL